MRSSTIAAVLACASLFSGCSSPNVRAPGSYAAVQPPLIKNFYYDLYAPYGSANATWRPPVYDRQGTIVKPADPSTQSTRPNLEHAPWAYGASGGSPLSPPGTF